MYEFIFVTGAGRCGTNILTSLIDGHSQIDVVPGEYTDFLGCVRRTGGYGTQVDLVRSSAYLLNFAFRLFEGDDDYAELCGRVEKRFADLMREGRTEISANEFLSHLCESIFEKPKGVAVVNVCNDGIAEYLEAFPNCRILHMLRNPLTQMNSRYRFRFADANSFGGSTPGFWEFGMSLSRNHMSFREASRFQDHRQVHVIRMEDLQADPSSVLAEVSAFLGARPEEINETPTRRGLQIYSASGGNKVTRSKVFVREEDWSCLTPNDLYYCGRIDEARQFYDIPRFPFARNSFFYFLRRQLGFVGKNRKLPKSPYRILKLLVISIAQYFQDVSFKITFDDHLAILSNENENSRPADAADMASNQQGINN